MDLYQEFANLIDLLNEAGIDYAVCGGVALALHGHIRFTNDIDILVLQEDVEKIRSLVARHGFDLPAARLPFAIGTERERWVVRISKIENGDHLILDLLLVAPIYQQVWDGRHSLEWKGRPIRVVSREGLGIMKRLAGRHQDLADLVKLGLLEERKEVSE